MKSLKEFLNECCPEMSERDKDVLYPLIVASIIAQLIYDECEEVGIDDRGSIYLR